MHFFKFIFVLIGGCIGWFLGLLISSIIYSVYPLEKLYVRVIIFITIVIFTLLSMLLFKWLEKSKHFNKFIFIFSALLLAISLAIIFENTRS